MNNIILRSFYYLNNHIIEDYFASIDGMIRQEQTETQMDQSKKTSHWKILDQEKGKEISKSSIYRDTPSSLFTRLYSVLETKNLFKIPDKYSSEITTFNKRDLIEIEGETQPVAMNQFISLFETIFNSPFVREGLLKGKNVSPEQIKLFETFFSASKGDNQKIEDVKIYPSKEPDFSIILQIDKRYIQRGSSLKKLLHDEFKVFGKIVKVLPSKEETYNLFRFLGALDMKKLPGGDKVLQDMIDNFKKPEIRPLLGNKVISEDDFYLSGPALIINPIAIYKE